MKRGFQQTTSQDNLPGGRPTAASPHRPPPISVVVIRDTPPSANANGSIRPEAKFAGNDVMTGRSRFAVPSSRLTSSPFRLQPRGKAIATPSPSFDCPRGRKRSAQCLTSGSIASVAQDLFETKGGVSHQAVGQASGETEADHPPSTASPPNTTHSPKQCTTPFLDLSPAAQRTPSKVELALQSLTIKSPRVTSSTAESSSFSLQPARRPGSSFILYSSSPMGVSYVRPRSEAMSTPPPKKVPGSSQSSQVSSQQKIAPLTVLQQSNSKGEVATPTNTQTQRPPRHAGPSSLVFSVESKRGIHDESVPRTPMQPPANVNFSAHLSAASTITKEPSPEPSSRYVKYASPKTDAAGGAHFLVDLSPARAMSSPTTRHSRSRRSPRTHVPSIKLTPRSESSQRSLPMMPSPSERGLGLLPNDLILHRPGKAQQNPAMEQPLLHAGQPPQPGRPLAMAPIKRPFANNEQRPRPFAFQPDCATPTAHQSPLSSSNKPSPAGTTSTNYTGVADSNAFGVKTTSLLTPSKSGSKLNAMMEANKGDNMDGDGSLTDTDDDASFILANPADLVEERQPLGRARQRPRRFYNSVDRSSFQQSSLSLASSKNASNTSLLGMDFIRAESTSSLQGRDHLPIFTTSGQEPPAPELRSALGEAGNDEQRSFLAGFNRLQSEGSLASIGLALEPAPENNRREDPGRALSTPPAIPEYAIAPPPLSKDNDKMQTTSSVCISRSDPAAVNMTIARMVHQTHPLHGMECSS